MTSDEILNSVKAALSAALNIPADSIKSSANLKEDLALDSMSSLTFLTRLEDSIPGFTIDPDHLDMDDLKTVESVSQYIRQSLGVSA